MYYAEPTNKVKSNEILVLVYKNDEIYKEFPTLKSTHANFLEVFEGFSRKEVWDVINSKVDETVASTYS